MCKKSLTLAITAALGLVLAAPGLQAATSSVVATVTKTMVTGNGTYGGCMAMLSVDPAKSLPTCGKNFVSFGCSNAAGDQLSAYRMLDQAQLALAGAKNVTVYFTDTTKYNGYCLATRIDVY
ncbi:hypothetical protein [uncultured Thiodictyon sp.]|uniref:hypothetical protein n=1 Tax=uncultured Thiodictyon sp. TaxID=1846217 RepID=UPI0025F0B594|nr:hypothetical protein [uncultured Thiodictyon sp.]